MFRNLLLSRALRSIGLVFISIASPLYLKEIGFSPLLIGLTFSGTFAYTAIMSVSLGMLGDRKGYKKSLIIAEGLSTLGVLLLLISPSSLITALGIIFAGITGGVSGLRGLFSPGLTALIVSNWRDETERVKKMGALASVSSISSMGGSLMLSLTNYLPFGKIGNYKFLFFLSFLMLLTSFLLIIPIREERRPPKGSKIMRKSSLKYLIKVITANSIGSLGVGMSVPFLSLFFSLYYHAKNTEIGEVFTLNFALSSLGSYLATKIRGNTLNFASFTRIINGLTITLIAFSPWFTLSAFIFALRGLSMGFGAPNRTAINVRGISSEDYGTASSLQSLTSRIANMSSGLGGYLMDLSVPLPLEIGGILQALSGVLYLKLFSEKREKYNS
ncbi:MFS transporter [Saccharolobus caldissimus]|nr:MFS transporter [Saccharolobus caldissimus]